VKKEKVIPFDFVVQELDRLRPTVRSMFGCFAVYVDIKIMLMLRNRPDHLEDNGVWVATADEHHDSLKKILPSMRPIKLLGKVSKWQNLPVDSDDFEENVMKVCQLILKGDVRIGTIPKSKTVKKKKSGVKKSSKKS
jgi:hypothetical protein